MIVVCKLLIVHCTSMSVLQLIDLKIELTKKIFIYKCVANANR